MAHAHMIELSEINSQVWNSRGNILTLYSLSGPNNDRFVCRFSQLAPDFSPASRIVSINSIGGEAHPEKNGARIYIYRFVPLLLICFT